MFTSRAFAATAAVSLCMLSGASDSFGQGQNARKMVPIEPLPVETGTLVDQSFDLGNITPATKPEDVLIHLPITKVDVTTLSVDESGKLTYLVASVSASKNVVHVTQDWISYTTVPKDRNNPDGLKIRIGVGVRIGADIVVTSGSVDTSTLFGLGVAAQKKQLQGLLSVTVIGINGKQIAALIPAPAPLSIDNINVALQSLAVIKAKVYDAETHVVPQKVAEEVEVKGDKKHAGALQVL